MLNERKPVIVTVTDDKLESIYQVAELLTTKGLQVEQVLPLTGVIVGTSALNQISDLEKIDGVMGVEQEVVAYPL
jgi:predicted CoA-binding protein